jgi:PTH1 family peptidyl-tRNA hydrolase
VKLIVGLGNPGYEYYLTPHNLGFMAVDRLAESCGVEISRREAQALTFMNLSGMAVARLLARYELAVEDLIVLVDDVDLPFGSLRVRRRGSAGSHNGLKSIIGALESDQFCRVRMGVKPERPVEDLVSYVLGPFRKADLEVLADVVDQAGEAMRLILKEGISRAMNRYNRRSASPQ